MHFQIIITTDLLHLVHVVIDVESQLGAIQALHLLVVADICRPDHTWNDPRLDKLL